MLRDLNLNVDRFYAVLAVYFLGRDNIGRRKLSRRLGLTESKTRTLLDHLRDAGFVEAGETMKLDSRGRKTFSLISERIVEISEVDLEHISVREENIAALMRDVEIESSIEIRDEAVRGGAGGMTILTFEAGFNFPEDERPDSQEILSELGYLEEKFPAENDDKLLISSARDLKDAKSGLWNAVSSLIDLKHLNS